ncbi:fatty acid desaturase family protein [Pseudomonas chlororaphis]|uniref:fatty acid desaturase family protein n=1 Tax=Pseudomonas chlororaphis TaxID=587753 RepID=UPI0018AFC4B5|nr:fatty acid desaturase [Pseudomonas chlororaphis]
MLSSSDKRKLADIVQGFAHERIGYSYFCLFSTVLLWLAAYAAIVLSDDIYIGLLGCAAAVALNIRLFVIYHDYCHGALLKHANFLTRSVFGFFGLFIFFPPAQWTRSHDEHHRTNSILNFGTYSMTENYLSGYFMVVNTEQWAAFSPRQKVLYKLRRSGFSMVLGLLVFFVLPTLVKGVIDFRRCWTSFLSVLLHGALLLGLYRYAGSLSVLLYIASLLIATAVGSYLFYAQHNFRGAKMYETADWDYLDAAFDSTSFFSMGRLGHWVTANIGYHQVHHINARVPFYQLPAAMAAIEGIAHVHRTTWRISDIVSNLSCHVWDEKRQQFIRYEEIDRPADTNSRKESHCELQK